MTSVVVEPVANRLRDLAAAIPRTPTVTAYTWEPRELGDLPAAVVRPPSIRRTPVDPGGESQLGSTDWTLVFPVDLYFDLTEPPVTQSQAVDYAEAFIGQIDSDPGLGAGGPPLALDSKVVSSSLAFYPEMARPLAVYTCEVNVLKLVNQ